MRLYPVKHTVAQRDVISGVTIIIDRKLGIESEVIGSGIIVSDAIDIHHLDDPSHAISLVGVTVHIVSRT